MSDGTFRPALTFSKSSSYSYAVAKPATDVPTCGLRNPTLLAITSPDNLLSNSSSQRLVAGLTADSTLGLMYLGDYFLGGDIGVRLTDNSVVRFRSNGGSSQPWAVGHSIGQGLVLHPVPPAGALSTSVMKLDALVSGSGATKVVVRLGLDIDNGDGDAPTAVFVSPGGTPATFGCLMPGAPGAGISQRPSDGDTYVFMQFGNLSTYRGAPVPATFGTRGELASVQSASITGLPYELAGNADASIGRVTARLNGDSAPLRSAPYAAVRPGAAVPARGTVVYDLVAATGIAVMLGGDTSEVPPGTVSSAQLQITYGEYPRGTPSPFYNTASLRVEGKVGDLPFVMADAANSALPLDERGLGAAFGTSQFQGAVSAPSADYAALSYTGSLTGTSVVVRGTLLFRKHP